MSIEEYVFITISLIYGLALTRLISGFFNFIKAGIDLKTYWPFLLWGMAVAIMLIWYIWLGFKIQANIPLNYTVFVLLLTTTTLLYGAVEFTFPNENIRHFQSVRYSSGFVFLYLFVISWSNYILTNTALISAIKQSTIGLVISLLILIRPTLLKYLAPAILLYAIIVHTPLQKYIGLMT